MEHLRKCTGMAVITAGLIIASVSASGAGGDWNYISGTYYEFSPYYALTSYRSLEGAGRILHSGFMLSENNGVVGTLLLTLSPQQAEEVKPEKGYQAVDNSLSQGKTAESDLLFLFSDLNGVAGGFEWNFYLGSFSLRDFAALKVGLKLGIVNGTYTNADEVEGKWTNFSLGIPLRLKKYFFSGLLAVQSDFDFNLISLLQIDKDKSVKAADDISFASSPFRLGVKVSPHHHLFGYGGISLTGIEEGGFGFNPGFYGGAGVRF